MGELEQAARDYVAARIANDAAEPIDWLACAARVDGAWFAMLEAFENEDQVQQHRATALDARAVCAEAK
jgi:hypothetical protein